MLLPDKVNFEIKEAMKARNEARLRTFRNIKSAFLLLQSSGTTPEESDYLKTLQKMARQIRDSIDIFTQEGRTDLANKEGEELAVIEELLPAQMSGEEIMATVKQIIEQTGAAGMKDLGKVMPLSMKALSGKADGKVISEVVKKLLS